MDQCPHTDLHQPRVYLVTSDPSPLGEFLDELWLTRYSVIMKGRTVIWKDVVYTLYLLFTRWEVARDSVIALALCGGVCPSAASTRLDLFPCSGNTEGCQELMTAKVKWLLGMQWGKEKLLGFPPPLVRPYVVSHELDWVNVWIKPDAITLKSACDKVRWKEGLGCSRLAVPAWWFHKKCCIFLKHEWTDLSHCCN